MATMIIFHEVKSGDQWADAWRKGRGSRHELFAKVGVKARTFRDPKNFEATGVILDVPDMAALTTFLESAEVKKAMDEDGLRLDTLRMLVEFTP